MAQTSAQAHLERREVRTLGLQLSTALDDGELAGLRPAGLEAAATGEAGGSTSGVGLELAAGRPASAALSPERTSVPSTRALLTRCSSRPESRCRKMAPGARDVGERRPRRRAGQQDEERLGQAAHGGARTVHELSARARASMPMPTLALLVGVVLVAIGLGTFVGTGAHCPHRAHPGGPGRAHRDRRPGRPEPAPADARDARRGAGRTARGAGLRARRCSSCRRCSAGPPSGRWRWWRRSSPSWSASASW